LIWFLLFDYLVDLKLILFSQNKTKAANFNLCSQDNNAHQVQHSTPAAVGRSQMWLDYARDVVVVNNETVSGGVDSVIGALVRHMAEKVSAVIWAYCALFMTVIYFFPGG
jgi:hypothetical protein